MAVTDPDARPHERATMFIVPVDTPGVRIVRDVATMEHPADAFGTLGGHAEIRYEDVRIPVENRLGDEGLRGRRAARRRGPCAAGPRVARILHRHAAGGDVPLRPGARLYDGPDEVHRQTVARRLLRGYAAPLHGVPSEHVPTRRAAAREQFAHILVAATAND